MAEMFFEELAKIPIPSDLRDKYESIIAKGKKSRGLALLGEKYKGPKYDPTRLDETGAIGYDEGVLLYQMVRFFKPQNIVEIGTWYGTSAMFMAEAMKDNDIYGTVYTCDKNNLYVGESDTVEYNNCLSGDFLKKLLKKNVQVDMVFTDGRFYPKDAKRIQKLMPNILFATHDYYKHEKGWRNVQALRLLYDKFAFYRDTGIMAFMINQGLFYAAKARRS